jgi:hypothetical protein
MPVLPFYNDVSRCYTISFALGIFRTQEDRAEMFLELCEQSTRDINLDPVGTQQSVGISGAACW